MNTYKINSLIISLAIICIAGVVAYYLHLQNDRYVIINSENGIAYELDKKSGETWWFWQWVSPIFGKGARYVPVDCYFFG